MFFLVKSANFKCTYFEWNPYQNPWHPKSVVLSKTGDDEFYRKLSIKTDCDYRIIALVGTNGSAPWMLEHMDQQG